MRKSANFIPLFAIIFIDTASYFLVIPVFLQLFINIKTSILPLDTSIASRNFFYGTAITLSSMAFLIFSPIAGNLSDYHGRKPIMLACLITAIVGFLLPIVGIYKQIVSLILIGRFIAGLSTTSQPVAQAAITDFADKKNKSFYLGMIGFAMTLGMVIGPLMGSLLSDPNISSWFSLKTPYWLGVFLAVINLLLLYFFFSESHSSGQQLKKIKKLSGKEYIKLLLEIVSQQKLVGLFFVFLFLELAWSQYFQSIFLYLDRDFHYSNPMIGFFAAYIGLWMCLGLTIIYKIMSKFFKIKTIIKIGLVGITIGLIGCCNIANPTFQWITVVPVAIFVGTTYPSLLTLISNRASNEHQGWVLGLASTLLGIAWIVTGFFSGLFLTLQHLLPLIMATVFIASGSVLFFFLSHKHRIYNPID